MDEKPIKQIKTQMPFPLLIYKTHIKYNEVRKASGISYILLELISKQRSDIRFREALLKFGIPTALHSIFGNEISMLVKTEIVESPYYSTHFENPRFFSEIAVNDVRLTEKGIKLFKEGAIPTGLEKEKAKEIFFSPVTRKFDVQSTTTYSTIASCFLGEEFLDNVEKDISGLEDWLNANTTKVGLKAEERLISFETEEPQKMNTRTEDNITLNIYPSHIEFTFSTSDERMFFDKYYSSASIEQGMTIKEKFKFKNLSEKLRNADITMLANLVALYLPEDFEKQAKRPGVMFLHRGNIKFERQDNIICVDKELSARLLDIFDEKAEFAILDRSGCRYYCAVNLSMKCKNFGDTLSLPFLTESKADEDVLEQVIGEIYAEYRNRPFDDDVAQIVTYAIDVLHAPDYFENFIHEKLQYVSSVDEKIGELMKLDSAFKKHSAWKKYFEIMAMQLYDDNASEIKLENIIYKNTILLPLKDRLQISNMDHVRKISKNICKIETKEIVYEALDSAGFGDTEILSVANVVELFISAVLENGTIASETTLATKFKTVKSNLWKLNDMLGVESSAEYTLREDYNTDEFFNAYGTLQSAVNAIEKYKQFAPKEYELLGRYLTIYEPIHEILSIERTASSNPEKITKKYIDEYIARGKYKDAICDLFVKLQYDLRKLLQAEKETPANELIDNAFAEKLIDKSQVSALHKLRMCRNAFQHPELKQIPFDKPTIENWRDIVFGLVIGSFTIEKLQISDLELNVDTYNSLNRAGIKTVKQVLDYTQNELLHVRNFGKKNLDDLYEKLSRVGLKIKD